MVPGNGTRIMLITLTHEKEGKRKKEEVGFSGCNFNLYRLTEWSGKEEKRRSDEDGVNGGFYYKNSTTRSFWSH